MGIWLELQRNPEKAAAYNIGGLTDVDGTIVVPVLEQAIRHVVERTPALRFRMADGGRTPRQYVAAAEPQQLKVVDFSGVRNPEAAAYAWMQRQFAEPLPLREAELFRFALLKLSPRQFLRFGRYHH